MTRFIRTSTLLLAFFALLFVATSDSRAEPWKAGVAKVNITPAEYMWMAGYAARDARRRRAR